MRSLECVRRNVQFEIVFVAAKPCFTSDLVGRVYSHFLERVSRIPVTKRSEYTPSEIPFVKFAYGGCAERTRARYPSECLETKRFVDEFVTFAEDHHQNKISGLRSVITATSF